MTVAQSLLQYFTSLNPIYADIFSFEKLVFFSTKPDILLCP